MLVENDNYSTDYLYSKGTGTSISAHTHREIRTGVPQDLLSPRYNLYTANIPKSDRFSRVFTYADDTAALSAVGSWRGNTASIYVSSIRIGRTSGSTRLIWGNLN